jgi:phosphoribosylformimino-5-aminoimidazole carboxamide ribotide isomerase
MRIVPSIDLDGGRSRIVFWPGAATGVGAPTDQPARIARHFVDRGATLIHLVDFDGARAGAPQNLAAIGAVAGLVATPLQVAGGMESPEAIKIAFATGATRVVVGAALLDEPELLAACAIAAGDWLAVGLDPRPDRLTDFPWKRASRPTIDDLLQQLSAAGIQRIVLSHGGNASEASAFAQLAQRYPSMELSVAGGVTDLDGVRRLRDAGVSSLILGEALLSGAIDFEEAQALAAQTQ